MLVLHSWHGPKSSCSPAGFLFFSWEAFCPITTLVPNTWPPAPLLIGPPAPPLLACFEDCLGAAGLQKLWAVGNQQRRRVKAVQMTLSCEGALLHAVAAGCHACARMAASVSKCLC